MRFNSTLFFLIIASFLFKSFAQSESEFYTETFNNTTLQKNLKTDYGVNGIGSSTDSEKLQQAINEVSLAGGGKILLPFGNYMFGGIIVKSNVHILIEPNSTISPFITDITKSISFFLLGDNGIFANNVSIRAVSGKYFVNLPVFDPGIRIFTCGSVANFYLADFTVKDNYTKFACVSMGITTADNIKYTWPLNGVVKNGSVIDAAYGYGLVQVQAAENILFKDLDGIGGATLRVETGWTKMNNLQIGTANKIYGRNISCTNGNSAVMVSPHAMHNGSVDIDGVTAYSSGFAVRIEGGFISKDYTAASLTVGTFSSVKVRNVVATFGTSAQLKSKHFKFLPTYRTSLITTNSQDGGESVNGPSIVAALNDGDTYAANVQVSKVTGIGFLCQKPIIDGSDINSTMDCTPSINNTAYDEGYVSTALPTITENKISEFHVYPNPMMDKINLFIPALDAVKLSTIKLYNSSGIEIRKMNLTDGLNTIDATDLNTGVYLIVLSNNLFSKSKLLVKY